MPDAYGVEWSSSAKRDLGRPPEKVAPAVVGFIYGGLVANPYRVGHALHFELAGSYSARRGDFRVIYQVDEQRSRVVVVAVDRRADVYRRR